jgi:glutathione S-transferase
MTELGYWNIRGLAQPIRNLLAYLNIEFQDIRYQQKGPEENFDRSAWTDKKATMEDDFPFINLPYFQNGAVKLTQSMAILNYIANNYGLNDGKTIEELANIEMVSHEICDLRTSFVRLCYSPDFCDESKQRYLTFARSKLGRLDKYLGDRKWIVGESISVADFLLFELLAHHCQLDSMILGEFPSLQSHMNHFQNIEHLKDYMKRSQVHLLPLNNRSAKFGGEFIKE